jgi:DnaJ domain
MGNRAFNQLLATQTPPKRQNTIQRITLPEAIEALGDDAVHFAPEIQPILLAMASKKGQDLTTFLAELDKSDYLQLVSEILEPIATKKVASPATHPITYVPSTTLPGFQEVAGTNIYITSTLNFQPKKVTKTTPPTGLSAIFGGKGETTITTQSVPVAGAVKFVNSILRSGPVQWYRGMAIDHFAWEGLRKGYLASEGTDKTPTFTMAGAGGAPTRWLPGCTGEDGQWTAKSIAGSIQEDAIATLWADQEVVMGAVLSFEVTPGTPIAYMNGNEQLLRGPLGAPSLKVASLAVRDRGVLKFRVPANKEPQALPPTYPYQVELGSQKFVWWVQAYNEWAESHGFAVIPVPPGALVLGSDEPTLTVVPDLSLQMAFAILELPPKEVLSVDLLRTHYKKLALRLHPDHNAGNEEEATAAFKRLQEAYVRITDGAQKREVKLIAQ